MNKYQILITLIIPILVVAILSGVTSSIGIATASANAPSQLGQPGTEATLDNVRAYVPSPVAKGLNYANAGGKLLAGSDNQWSEIALPTGVVAAGIAVDPNRPETVYVGAANQTALYRTQDGGQSWLRVPLAVEFEGAISALAVDGQQRMIYAGTDSGVLFRLRDVGSSIILAGKQAIGEAVIEMAADSTGAGLAFARTQWSLYRAENGGLSWQKVDTLMGIPTALAIANSQPAVVYVGTTDSGLLKSIDGVAWMTANAGLGLVPGSRLQVDALTVDPMQPDVLYVATSYLYGSTQIHQSPVGVAMSKNHAASWESLREIPEIAVSQLLPVSGKTGAVYALLSNSRTPFALGDAAQLAQVQPAEATSAWNQSLADSSMTAWLVAMVAAIALLVLVALEQNARTKRNKLAPQRI